MASDLGLWKMKKKRDSLEIVKDMLSIVLEKTKKTRIMYQANLNYHQLEKYLTGLLERGLVKYDNDRFYLITWKGRNFLRTYSNYVKRCRKIRDEIKGVHKDRVQLEIMCFDNEPVPNE